MAASEQNKEHPKVSYHRKPNDISIEKWQVELRKQFAAGKPFTITKTDGHEVFSDYNIFNPETSNNYKVSIRSSNHQHNYCSCMDFKTNCLGTCKHIEAVMHHIHSDKKLESLLNTDYIPYYTSVYLQYGHERKIRIRYGSINREEFEQWAKKYFDENNNLIHKGLVNFTLLIDEARRISDDFRIYPDVIDYLAGYHDKNRRLAKLKAEYDFESETSKLDELVKTTLFPYQKEGIYKAACAGRFLIADDMGLGKTIQAIATAELLRKITGISSVLIICPTSLKYQWKSEIEKFSDSTVLVIEGNKLKREPLYFEEEYFYKIISYNTVLYDADIIKFARPDLVILDEAQRIKNFKTKIAMNVKKIPSDFALVLTGTPLENKLEELYSIIQFVDPFALGPFYSYLDEHQIKDEGGKITGYRNLNVIGRKLQDILIRRKRAEVLTQLPERMDKILFVPMTQKQKEIHYEYAMLVSRIISKWKRLGFLSETDRQRLMIALNMMRMVCDSTYIIDQETRYDTKIDELMELLDEFFGEGNDKVVIFSQWERMTRLVGMELDKRKIKYEYLHGGVESKKRKDLFYNFNNDPNSRVFLSTDAGGVGLNLQAACMIINLDIPWNPAVLEQRIGRVYRMGQNKNVTVINFVSSMTIEHRMLEVLKFKTSLSEGVLDDGEDMIFMQEDRFREFMKTVQKLVDDEVQIAPAEPAEEKIEQMLIPEAEILPIDSTGEEHPVEVLSLNPGLLTDDDIKENVLAESQPDTADDPLKLIQNGIHFFTGLSKVLSDKEATAKLVSSIVEKDPSDGKYLYLKIPVESEGAVTSVLGVIAGLFSALGK